MITISTGGIGPMDITTNTKAKGASKEEDKAIDAFASLMNMVSTKQGKTEEIAAGDMDVSEVAQTKDSTKDYEAYSKQEEVNSAKDKLHNAEKTSAKEDTQAAKAKKTKSDVESDDETVDQAVALIKEVKSALKEALGISDEELDGLLADMGINMSELLLGDNLKNFILQVQGATNVELLVNENLANLVADLTNRIAELINQFGFSDESDFKQLMVENAEIIELALQNTSENVDINDSLVASQEVEATDADADDKTIKTLDDQNNLDMGDDGLSGKILLESTSDNGQATSQDQSANQSNQQIVANLNQAIDNTVNANTNVDATTFTSNVQEADIIRQIIDQIKVNVGREVQSMEVQLNPENLGKVYVNVEAKDGVMQAKIIAETEAAKNAIENNLAVLKENFSNNELKVEAIEVMVAAYGFFEESQNNDFGSEEQSNDTSKAIGGINVNNLVEEELTQEEELEVEIMKSKGNTVSYTV